MKPGCSLIAYLHAKPEKREELLKILLGFVKPSREEAACIDYHLHVSNDDPNFFIFYENWRSREELDQHLQTPMLTNFWARRLDLLEKDVEIKFITMLSEIE
jgi:quinol monooxygenase YgiN